MGTHVCGSDGPHRGPRILGVLCLRDGVRDDRDPALARGVDERLRGGRREGGEENGGKEEDEFRFHAGNSTKTPHGVQPRALARTRAERNDALVFAKCGW